ncbi:Alpha-crystallin B chain-like [Homarus americanus]|uniref:Alpha-crystallin B chain-like n=1 Tax=Homarus americanus TaxID=6706 RepID=A0A8J5N444_HOMAM|nr:Alpha-crystallin B chain-like [Homarus americanus]
MSRQIPMMYRDPFFRDFWGDRGDFFTDRREQVFDRPSKVFDQDVSAPSASLYTRCRRPPKERSGISTMCQEKNKFTMSLDVQQFKPEELKVRVVEGVVEVEGKHEQRPDEHGTISRHFVSPWSLPNQHSATSPSARLRNPLRCEVAPVIVDKMASRKTMVLSDTTLLLPRCFLQSLCRFQDAFYN